MSEQGVTQGPKLLAHMVQRRRLTTRRAAVVIGVYTIVVTVVGGTLARLVDRHDFHSRGDAIWWALQTVTTVGYGDIVPKSTVGRAVGGLLMVSGIAFLAVITASVTAALVEAGRARLATAPERAMPELAQEIVARLASIESRLEQLEASPRPDHD